VGEKNRLDPTSEGHNLKGQKFSWQRTSGELSYAIAESSVEATINADFRFEVPSNEGGSCSYNLLGTELLDRVRAQQLQVHERRC